MRMVEVVFIRSRASEKSCRTRPPSWLISKEPPRNLPRHYYWTLLNHSAFILIKSHRCRFGCLWWPSNPELFSDQRSMAGSTRLVSFSPYDYNNFSFYNIGGNNYTTGYDSFISNPPQETYLGTSLGLYPFSAKDYNTLFHYPSYSLPQMFIPSLATTPFLGYFSFPYLAPGLLTPGLSTPGLSSLGLSSLGLSSLGLSIGPFL